MNAGDEASLAAAGLGLHNAIALGRWIPGDLVKMANHGNLTDQNIALCLMGFKSPLDSHYGIRWN